MSIKQKFTKMFSWMFSSPDESTEEDDGEKKDKRGIGKKIDDFIDGKKEGKEVANSGYGRGSISDSTKRMKSFSKRAMDGKMSVEKRSEGCPKCGKKKVFNKTRGIQCTSCRYWIVDNYYRKTMER